MAEGSINLTKQDLEELLGPVLAKECRTLEDISVRYLTKPGENYGSTMLAVDVNHTPGPRTLPLVAKMLPKSLALRKICQCEVTARKEIYFYLLVRPAYERIQKENDVPEEKFLDVFPVCYGAWISSRGDAAPVDETSVILLENLKVQGFECGDRFIGLNLPHCELVVEKLARFHATAVAMKIKKPEEFKEIVVRTSVIVAEEDSGPNFTKPLENVPEYDAMKERIYTALIKSKLHFTSLSPGPSREPFATLTHLDLWTNNIMFRYGSEPCKENPVSLKLIDFQMTRYDSPARDLLVFLYTSAHLEVLSQHYDRLVRFYYDNFVDCLRIL
ncbi:hypothetical protein PR048_025267 [Dryococelus australis]|uniref:CHK kinase-like domain-containing protein n=1 Tax=Dryococelus australis TaxID=614101 RepID=A0ABQ9GQZ4_9NEOP|nr:hypothetical protein PR048_025267 [Dryococelus australis]